MDPQLHHIQFAAENRADVCDMRRFDCDVALRDKPSEFESLRVWTFGWIATNVRGICTGCYWCSSLPTNDLASDLVVIRVCFVFAFHSLALRRHVRRLVCAWRGGLHGAESIGVQ